jgi:RHS repeat-associated protein
VLTQYAYNRIGAQIKITDPLNHIRTFRYNAAGEQDKATDGLGRSTEWKYDALGRVVEQLDPRGVVGPTTAYNLTYSYDGLDRLTQTAAGSASTLSTITTSYDALGRRRSLVDGSGTTSFSHDALGRMRSSNAPSTGLLDYSYNGRGDRITLVYPDATTLNYSYFEDGQLKQVTQGAVGPTTLATYAYDVMGRLAQTATKDTSAPTSQLVTNYGYDSVSRVRAVRTSEAGTPLGRFQYQTDRIGMRTVLTETLPLSPLISPTRLKTITFEAANLIDPVSGANSINNTVLLTSTNPLKESYSAVIPNTGDSYLRENITASDEVFVTFYVRVTALPASSARLLMITNGVTSTATVGNIQFLTSGKLRLRNDSSQIGADSTLALALNTLYRVGLHQKKGSGNAVLEAYLAVGDTPFGSPFAASTVQTISTQAVRVQVGATNPNGAGLVIDDIAIDGSTFAPPSLALASTSAGINAPSLERTAQSQQAADDTSARASLGTLPLAFVPNSGQADSQARFVTHSMGGSLFFTPDGIAMALPTPQASNNDAAHRGQRQRIRASRPLVVQMQFIDANATPRLTGLGNLPGKVNYLVGNDPSRWRTNLPSYASLAYGELYAGIELRYDGGEGQVTSTFNVAPGADPTHIQWRYTGARELSIDGEGNLVINLPPPNTPITATNAISGTLLERAPRAWQVINDAQVEIPVRYVLKAGGRVGFALGAYDRTQPLTIDPTLTYTTYLGGSGNDFGEDIATDRDGNVYMVGTTSSSTFLPTPLRAYQAGSDAFVAKLSADGSRYLYTTYLGGSDADNGYGIAVDNAGSAYITGATRSNTAGVSAFPTTAGVIQASSGGSSCTTTPCADAFVAKLDPIGSALLYSTRLGGSNDDDGRSIAVDITGNAYITGMTSSSNFPSAVSSPLQSIYGGGTSDGFAAKINTGATALVYRTYLGGSLVDVGEDIAIDSGGNAYVVGTTNSGNVPPFSGGLQGAGGGNDAFVVKINPTGTSRVYGTLIGGASADAGNSITVDTSNNVYVVGTAGATNIPNITTGTNTGTSAFVAKLTGSTTPSYANAQYVGGSGSDAGYATTLAANGEMYITGETTSNNFPNVWAGTYRAGIEGFMARITPGFSFPGMNLYLFGTGTERGKGIAGDRFGNIYLTGDTNSTDFMISGSTGIPCPCPVQGSLGGLTDAFVVKVRSDSAITPPSAGTRVITYSYDGQQRLVGAAENPGTVLTYTYDLAGNRTSVWEQGAQVEQRSYDVANQVVGWDYDKAGNLRNDGTTTYSYDALNRMITAQRGGEYRGNTYNGDGVLVKQVTPWTWSNAISYTQDLAAPLSQVLQIKQGSTTTNYLYGVERLASVSGATRTWYLADALGSVRRTIDDSGTALSPIYYDPWGNVEAASFLPSSGGLPIAGFTGELHDPAIGLVNLRARWYSTGQGRFMTQDSWMGDSTRPGTFNRYNYVENSPINRVDPTGHDWDANWDIVRQYRAQIIEAAQRHARSADGFTRIVTAALMGAHIAREQRNLRQLVDAAQDIYFEFRGGGDDQSTGLGNIRPNEVVRIFNGGLPDAPGTYNFHLSPSSLLFLGSCILGDHRLDSNDYPKILKQLRHNIDFTLDILGAKVEQGVVRARAKGLKPSIFNVGNWLQNGVQEPDRLWNDKGERGILLGSAQNHEHIGYAHGLAMVQQIDKAAEVLGLTSGSCSLCHGVADSLKYNTSSNLAFDESVFVKCQIRSTRAYGRLAFLQEASCGNTRMDVQEFMSTYGPRLDAAKIPIPNSYTAP